MLLLEDKYMWQDEIVEKIKNLISAIAADQSLSKEDRLYVQNFVIECCLSFPKYVVATNEYVFVVHSISESRANGDISQDEFERRLKNVDISRRNFHNKAIDSCNQLNRQCEKYGLDKICHIDTQNRSAVADFAANFAMAIHGYALDHNYTMDEVVQKMEKDPRMLTGKIVVENSVIER